MKKKDALLRLIDALAFSAERHRDQRRKGADADPYINHPIAVVRVLAVEGGIDDVKTLVAAVLHDTVEDTTTLPDEIAARFGKSVAGVVAEVTDDKALPKQTRKKLQVAHARDLSERAKLVKLGDKICNLRDLTKSPPVGWPLQRRQEYFDWAKSVVDGLRGVHPKLERLFDDAFAARLES